MIREDLLAPYLLTAHHPSSDISTGPNHGICHKAMDVMIDKNIILYVPVVIHL